MNTIKYHGIKLIRKWPRLFDLSRRIYRFFVPHSPLVEFLKNQLFNKRGSFIQVGANDGITCDAVREILPYVSMNGILVEPVPYLFEKLKANYHHVSQLSFENSAVSYSQAQICINYLSPDYLSKRVDGYSLGGLAGFSEQHIRNHFTESEQNELIIESCNVPCLTIEALIEKYSISKLEALFIDAEGMDAEILLGLNLTKFRPELILYEAAHLGEDLGPVIDKLSSFGYQIHQFGDDTVAIIANEIS
jgi:FkbM family methyltransferase